VKPAALGSWKSAPNTLWYKSSAVGTLAFTTVAER